MLRRAIGVLAVLGACAAPGVETSADGRIIRASAYIRADYDDVWERFTTVDGYRTWASSPCLEFAAEPGGPILWGYEETPVYRGTLESLEPGKGLVHTFQFASMGFDEPPSRVEIGIVPRGETTLVSIRHDCSQAPRTYETISPVGWTKSLSRLKTLLETGEPMPWPTEPVEGTAGATAPSGASGQ